MKFKIPVSWTMVADMIIEADDLDDAIEKAQEAPLPTDGEYCDSSFEVNTELIFSSPETFGEIK